MTNAELAAYLNAELSLTGAVAVTPNVIRQWVLWDVLPRAAGRGRGYAKGRSWQRSGRDLRRARQLAKWRASGVTREQALIVHAFIAWGFRDCARVREALSAEAKRSTAAVRKKISSDLTFHAFADVSATRKRAYRKQLGPLDDRLTGTRFELSGELYALAAQAMIDTSFNKDRLAQLIGKKILELELVPSGVVAELTSLLLNANTGLFASVDESDSSITSVIDKCHTRDLRIARVWLRHIQMQVFRYKRSVAPENTADLFTILRLLENEINTGHWQIMGLAAALNLRVAMRGG